MFWGEWRRKKEKEGKYISKKVKQLINFFHLLEKPTDYTWLYNKTSVWHFEVYELCSVIRAYFPAVEIEIYMFLLSTFIPFLFSKESEIYKLLLNNTRSASSYIMNSEVYKLPFDDAHISVCPPPLPPQEGTVKFIRLVKQTNKKLHY